MGDDDSLVERFVLGVDIEKYSKRTTRHQKIMQERLRAILDLAAREGGIDRAEWDVKGEGDGGLAALPPGADLARFIGSFVRGLDDRLRLHNEDHSPALRIRLRLAMHCDVLTPSAFGTAGPAFIEVARLLSAEPLREALLRDDQARLVLLVSPEVFRKVVGSDLASLRESDFTEVRVSHSEKDYEKTAHLHVPGRHPAPVPHTQKAAPTPPASGTTWQMGDGNKNFGVNNQIGGDFHLSVQEAPRADPLATGLTAFHDHDYAMASANLRHAATQAAELREEADIRFRLATAYLHGHRPRLHRRSNIQRIERELEKVLAIDPHHTGALLLWAITKQDYYQQNGFDYTGPPPDQMAAPVLRTPLTRRGYELAAEIVEHVPAPDNPIWSWIRAQVPPEETG
ncbi:hypothetical protein AGRA3207_001496 [Actinomadura graeca]|uniref:Uncharacterized protein n=1 Tax=Actinomadura graeca TaxID=2750812 RepID=A0ABX8QPW7_9ACTN|nr:hypothetical protein [Actinomadura graeca]QXJ20731.1 hypothetical protein AGRA3207_001496 [Actinomadura graeca]